MLLTAESIKKYIECEVEGLNKIIMNPKKDQETKDIAIQNESVLLTILDGIKNKKDESVLFEWDEMFKPNKIER